MKTEHMKYQAEGDLRTLVEAQRIRNDKTRGGAVMKLAEEHRVALDKLKKEKTDVR